MASTVGIFSRSDESEYAWLNNKLNPVCRVLPIYISNNNRRHLIESLKRCNFAILYHTKNRGRINITDVTDSLYDEEVELLCSSLGKDHVLAVIDDLDDSSEEIKERILSSQPTLQNSTFDTYLFTKLEKKNDQILSKKVQPIIRLIRGGTLRIPGYSAHYTNRDQSNNYTNPEGEGKPTKTVHILVVMAFSAVVIYEAFHSPNYRNLFLASFWAAGAIRTFLRKPSTYLWFNPQIHSMLSCTMTLVTLYNAYCRPSAGNVMLPAFWLMVSLAKPYRHNMKGSFMKAMGCGLVFYSFWKGWQMLNATNVSEMIVQTFLCSPITLAVL